MNRKPEDKAVAAARSTGFVWLVRAGFVARGLVYALIGGLALALALGAAGGSTTNQQGALDLIAAAPLGRAVLGVLAICLLSYAVWQVGQAILGRGIEDGRPDDAADRLGNLGSGVAYLGLFVLAVKAIFAGDQTSHSSGPRHAAAGVLGWPAGQWLVGLTGVVVVGVCVYLAHDALTGGYLEDAKTEQMTPAVRRSLDVLGRVGLFSRAFVFALVGYFLIRTAVDYDPAKAIGIDGALREVARQPYGSWLLGLVSLGLLIFAAASIAEARYHRL